MFFSLSKTIARFGGFRLGMGIRLTKKNFAILLFALLFVIMFQLMWYMLVVSFWLIYAMFYAMFWCLRKILIKNKIKKDNETSEESKMKTFMLKLGTVIQWILAIICLLFAIVYFFEFSSVLFLIASIFMAPIRAVRNFFNKKINNKIIITISIFFILAGLIFVPNIENTDLNNGDLKTELNNGETGNTNIKDDNKNDASGDDNKNDASSDDNKNDASGDDDKNDVGDDDNKDDTNDNSSNVENQTKYILNTKSKKIHYPSCRTIKNMSEENKQEYVGDKEALFDEGYTECGVCH